EQRVDHRSLKDQGLERLPTRHLGPAAHAMEKRGISTERGDLNRVIEAANRFQAKSREVVQQLDAQIIDLEQERSVRLWDELKTPGERYADPLLACDSFQGLAEAYRASRQAINADQSLDAEDKQDARLDLKRAFQQMKPELSTRDAELMLQENSQQSIETAYQETFDRERAFITQRADRILERIDRNIHQLKQST
ncbi:MAG: MobA/MobL family protein, partial [Thiolinea sp.]